LHLKNGVIFWKARFALKHSSRGRSPDVWIFESLRARRKRASTRI